ncbi:caspase-2-like [Saccostrea echinata]|uniref:caspase-2-like n=1 Tax=Saccostrea echinata TaxID=191078 RepID=UPI002A7F5068|nr:caspase-2-like [Saccostrea echinata]
MDQIHKDALRRTRVALVKDLDVDVICDEVLEKDIFTQLMMEYIMAERTRIDKVRRLLDDLVRRGPNAYQAFLQVLDISGYRFLANQIRKNEELVRRQKEPNTSVPIQATNESYSEIHPSSISSGFSNPVKAANLNFNARNTTAEPTTSHPIFEPNSMSLGTSASNFSSSNASPLTSSMASSSRSETGSLSVTETESSVPSESADDDTLDLESEALLNPTSMDVDDEDNHIDLNTEEVLLRGSDNRQNEGFSIQPSDTSSSSYSLNPPMTMPISFYHQSRSLDKCYVMESDPRGIVLIINNKDFGKNHKDRTGTEHDCQKLKDLFKSLSFKVVVKDNLTVEKMVREFQVFANRTDLENTDCMVLAVLSHGTSDNIICGVDGRGIDVYDIFHFFSAKGCPMMRGKPKMFIFNACRGDKSGESIEINNTLKVSSTVQTDKLQKDGPNAESTDRQILDMQDLLLCFSTFPGYSSYRDTNEGSWFIQEFVSVFEEQAHSEHVMDMLTDINRRVSQKKHHENASETCVQMPFPSTSMTKKWFINPPQNGATSFAY